MRLINPFSAVIPVPDKAALVVSRDYLSYSPEELHAILEYNPYSFLHIINPGYRFDKEVSGEERNSLVRNRYLEFLQAGIFEHTAKPALYLYQLDTEQMKCLGVIGNLHLSHYQNKKVKPHEKTLKSRIELFKEYLKVTRIQTDPVLLIHQDHAAINEVFSKIIQDDPALNFTTPDKSQHQLWKITDTEQIATISTAMEEVNGIYIADGHHRISSSAKLYEEEQQQNASAYVMSLYCAASQINISGFSRMVRDLNGLNENEFLIALDRYYIVEPLQTPHLEPSQANEFTMYLNGHFYKLTLRTEYLTGLPLEDLPPRILQRTLLKPILGIKSIRRSKRVAYDHCPQGELKMKELIDKGIYSVGFTHFPISFDQLTRVADHGLKMPPKSTYIAPKLKSALTLYEF